MAAVTFLEAKKLALAQGLALKAAIAEFYAGSSSILQVMQFMSILGGAMQYNQEDKLPGVGFRGVNEAFTPSVGVINPQTEALKTGGGEIDYDNFVRRTLGDAGEDAQISMMVRAFGLFWTKKFVKGDEGSDPREFDGLQKRLTGDQVIPAGSTSGGDALSLAKLDRLKRQTLRPTHFLMNEQMQDRLTQAARNTNVGGFISFTQDAFGNTQTVYNNLPILTINLDNEGEEIIGFTEANPGGGSAASTSIYCMSIETEGLQGLQSTSGLIVNSLGELETKPATRTRVEWDSTIALFNGRAAARLNGIKDAPVVV